METDKCQETEETKDEEAQIQEADEEDEDLKKKIRARIKIYFCQDAGAFEIDFRLLMICSTQSRSKAKGMIIRKTHQLPLIRRRFETIPITPTLEIRSLRTEFQFK